MFGRRFNDGKQAVRLFEVLVEIDSHLVKKGKPSLVEILEIVSMPDDLHRIQVVKRHDQLDFMADGRDHGKWKTL